MTRSRLLAAAVALALPAGAFAAPAADAPREITRVLERLGGRPLAPPSIPAAPTDVPTDLVTDGSLGDPTTIVEGPGGVYTIVEELGRRLGTNLFHSFLNFDLGSGKTAMFTANGATSHVIVRVTGGNPSQIFGKIASNLAGANFFFINSAGIAFGAGASLDVQGSFHASTADVLTFADGGTFLARPVVGETLSIAAPDSFGFLSQSPAAITVSDATLAVKPGQDLELSGGSVVLDHAMLLAPEGEVAVTATESIALGNGSIYAGDVALTGRTIRLESFFVNANRPLDARIRVTGEQIELVELSAIVTLSTGGRVLITVPERPSGPTSLVLRNSSIGANVNGGGDGGGLTVRGFDRIHLYDRSQLQSEVSNSATGGDILVEAGTLTLEGRSEISTQALEGDCTGGSITIRANRIVLLDGGSIESIAIAATHAGDIVIEADSILAEGAYLDPLDDTKAQPSGITSTSGALISTNPDAGAGNITITARDLQLLNGGRIAAETLGGGRGGNITITADTIVVAGYNEALAEVLARLDGVPIGELGSTTLNIERGPDYARSAISAGSEPLEPGGPFLFVNGDAGSVNVTAREISLSDRGWITSSATTDRAAGSVTIDAGSLSMEDAAIRTTAAGGTGGTITITGGAIDLVRSEITSSQTADSPSGQANPGGSVVMDVASLRLADGSSIRAESVGNGNAGSIAIATSGDLEVVDSAITTEATASFGGNIDLRADGILYVLRGRAETSVTSGAGSGGNVGLTGTYVALNDAEIRANADAGNGGNITIDAGTYLANPETVIDASSNTGISGAVTVNSPEVNVAGSLVQLPAEFLAASRLLRPSCAARETGAREGSFVVQRRRTAPEAVEPVGEAVARFLRPGAEDEIPTRGIRIVRDGPKAPTAAVEAEPVETVADAYARFSGQARDAQAANDDRALSFALGNLAALYEEAERGDEALYLTRRALRAAERADAPDALYRASWREGRLLRAGGRREEAVASFRRAVDVLEEIRIGAQGDYSPVYLDLVSELIERGSIDTLKEARGTVERLKAAELRDYFQDDCVAALESKSASLDDLATGAAIVYPILLPDRLEVLVTLPSGLRRYTSPVGSKSLSATAALFRAQLQDPDGEGWREPARSLYDAIVAPFAADLDRERVDTLVFVPDGALRTIPMAALHDGTRFLGERYALAITPSLALTDPVPLRREGLEILLGGVSDAVDGFPALPGVPAELKAIQAMRGGRVLLDDAFDVGRVEEAIRTSEPSVVHIASHAVFSGDPATSFVLTHDGRLTMDRLSEIVSVTKFRERPLEMLVLSACETAAGDDRAGLGLAGVAIRAGARSAVGSLWSIADEAATRVMESFYEELGSEGVSKAEALRRAQARLRGDARLSHPYFWSPFVVINNWK